MDSEFDEIMKIFRTNLPYEEVQSIISSYLEKLQIEYFKNIESEEYKVINWSIINRKLLKLQRKFVYYCNRILSVFA